MAAEPAPVKLERDTLCKNLLKEGAGKGLRTPMRGTIQTTRRSSAEERTDQLSKRREGIRGRHLPIRRRKARWKETRKKPSRRYLFPWEAHLPFAERKIARGAEKRLSEGVP